MAFLLCFRFLNCFCQRQLRGFRLWAVWEQRLHLLLSTKGNHLEEFYLSSILCRLRFTKKYGSELQVMSFIIVFFSENIFLAKLITFQLLSGWKCVISWISLFIFSVFLQQIKNKHTLAWCEPLSTFVVGAVMLFSNVLFLFPVCYCISCVVLFAIIQICNYFRHWFQQRIITNECVLRLILVIFSHLNLFCSIIAVSDLIIMQSVYSVLQTI